MTIWVTVQKRVRKAAEKKEGAQLRASGNGPPLVLSTMVFFLMGIVRNGREASFFLQIWPR
eukprot:CAMPEP_0171774768 /NCGR_PEP_ID=MMETSP0991-20121206/56090_1 /TAXON_ID=483369 /ORGANISM="non described non described, Strain CCMP2098" /LENGTH=60 /DNA_ID=CAMNT_0012380769 /DNA_START=21 /DNA_END=203 /DNA_ORIENTATION=-